MLFPRHDTKSATAAPSFKMLLLCCSLFGVCTNVSNAFSPLTSSAFLPRSFKSSSSTTSTPCDGPSTLKCVLQMPKSSSSGSGFNGDEDHLRTFKTLKNGYVKKTMSLDFDPLDTRFSSLESYPRDTLIPAEYVAETKLPTDLGQFMLRAYRSEQMSEFAGTEPCVIYSPNKSPFGKDGKLKDNVPVRIHDQCMTSEVFRSQR